MVHFLENFTSAVDCFIGWEDAAKTKTLSVQPVFQGIIQFIIFHTECKTDCLSIEILTTVPLTSYNV